MGRDDWGPRQPGSAEFSVALTSLPREEGHADLSRRLRQHFQAFGEVVDLRLLGEKGKAFVQFRQASSAAQAIESPDAVLGNRFVKVFRARRDNVSPEELRQRDARDAAREHERREREEARAARQAEWLAAQAVEREKRELAEKTRRVVQSKKADLLKKQIEAQKLLLAKMEEKSPAAVGPGGAPPGPTPNAGECGPGGGDEGQAGASSGGRAGEGVATRPVAPENGAEGGHGRGRGRGRGHGGWRGRGRGQGGWVGRGRGGGGSADVFRVDSTQTSIVKVLGGLPAGAGELQLGEHFSQFGTVVSVFEKEGEPHLVQFADRAQATKALIHGKSMTGSTLSMQWGPPTMPE